MLPYFAPVCIDSQVQRWSREQRTRCTEQITSAGTKPPRHSIREFGRDSVQSNAPYAAEWRLISVLIRNDSDVYFANVGSAADKIPGEFR